MLKAVSLDFGLMKVRTYGALSMINFIVENLRIQGALIMG